MVYTGAKKAGELSQGMVVGVVLKPVPTGFQLQRTSLPVLASTRKTATLMPKG
jgi:hypothetical protein